MTKLLYVWGHFNIIHAKIRKATDRRSQASGHSCTSSCCALLVMKTITYRSTYKAHISFSLFCPSKDCVSRSKCSAQPLPSYTALLKFGY